MKNKSPSVKVEIERKFLLRNENWRTAAVSCSRLSDGLFAVHNDSKVRIRTDDGIGLITIKGPRSGLTRAEFEYEIPLVDAESMLSALIDARKCSKMRYIVPYGSHVWHVDVYEGVLDDVIMAEIELSHENEAFDLPGWIGREVTCDPNYSKWAMLLKHTAANPTSPETRSQQNSWHRSAEFS